MSAALLAVEHLSKSFPGVKALDDVSMSIASGEIVALIGQNGSGKSTLVKILAGVYRADPGGAVSLAQDEDGESSSLHFIHQDLGLVPTLSTIENLDIGRELDGRRALRRVPAREERLRAETLIREFGADFDVTRPVATLTAAERSIVGIARALEGWTHDRNVLVLDEPTAALHGDEVEKLFVAVRQVASRGAGVIFISHRLDEVMDLTDRVVALRDGRLIADLPREQVRHDDLVQLIAGREVSRQESATHELGSPVLRARRVTGTTLRGVDLTIRSGEVVGVSGVLGSGRDELASVLFGATPGGVAEMWVDGEPADGLDPRRAIAAGVAFVPSDRHRRSAVMRMSARENMTIPRLYPLRRRLTGLIDRRLESREVGRWVSSVDVRPALPERPIALFSGGNQQKIILAKWLRNEPRVLLLEEPTQGIDVGARAGIYELVAAAAAAGAGVLVCSSDTEELAQICHRVLVLRDGRQVAELTGPQVTEAALIRASVGPIEEDSHRAAHTDTIDKEVPLDV